MEKVIVLVTHGKSTGSAEEFGVKLFNNRDEATTYCDKVTDAKSKYWTVAEIIKEGGAYESDRENGHVDAFVQDFM